MTDTLETLKKARDDAKQALDSSDAWKIWEDASKDYYSSDAWKVCQAVRDAIDNVLENSDAYKARAAAWEALVKSDPYKAWEVSWETYSDLLKEKKND